MARHVLFSERQRFTQWWLWLLIIGLAIHPFIIFYPELATGEPVDFMDFGISFIVTIPLVVLFILLRLETRITDEGITVRFFPFQIKGREYGWDEIREAHVRKYRPIAEFGGWGIRGLGNNKAYNVSGNMGLQLIFNDGRKLLIGTRKPEQLEASLRKAGKLQ